MTCVVECPSRSHTRHSRSSDNVDVKLSNINIKDVTIKEQAGATKSVGGFVGFVQSGCKLTIENCSFSGYLKFGTNGTKIGGFVGTVQSNASVTLEGCTISATIEAKAQSDNWVANVDSTATVTKNNCSIK